MIQIGLPAQPSALVVIFDRESVNARIEFRALVPATAQAGERILVLDAASGRRLGTYAAPQPGTARVPAPPAALANNPTSYQRATYHRAIVAWRATVNGDLARLRASERQRLATWAAMITDQVAGPNAMGLEGKNGGPTSRLNAAIADFADFSQAGVSLGSRKVLAILGPAGPRWTTAPDLPGLLQQVTVVASGFPATPAIQNAWRAGILRDGATRAIVLTPSTGSVLASVVARGLSGPAAHTASQP